jgi:hypothetical protein
MGRNVLGELWVFTLNYEENNVGGIEIWVFLGFWALVHVEVGRRGGVFVCTLCVWGNFMRQLG